LFRGALFEKSNRKFLQLWDGSNAEKDGKTENTAYSPGNFPPIARQFGSFDAVTAMAVFEHISPRSATCFMTAAESL
jgi:2-polyprenyl-3-methyl-5-hydroxy-6-metoxy-1,4-benzoquinol methylase